MTPKEKETIIKNINVTISWARWQFSEGSAEHIIACLNDRKIEIERGEWDD